MNIRTAITVTVRTFIGEDVHAESAPSHGRQPDAETEVSLTRVESLLDASMAQHKGARHVENILSGSASVIASQIADKIRIL